MKQDDPDTARIMHQLGKFPRKRKKQYKRVINNLITREKNNGNWWKIKSYSIFNLSEPITIKP